MALPDRLGASFSAQMCVLAEHENSSWSLVRNTDVWEQHERSNDDASFVMFACTKTNGGG